MGHFLVNVDQNSQTSGEDNDVKEYLYLLSGAAQPFRELERLRPSSGSPPYHSHYFDIDFDRLDDVDGEGDSVSIRMEKPLIRADSNG